MSEGAGHKAFDKSLRERLGEHELKPPADLWEKVNSRLANAKESEFDEVLQGRLRGHKSTPPEDLWKIVNEPSSSSFFLGNWPIIRLLGILFVVGAIGFFQHWRDDSSDVEKTVEIPLAADNFAEIDGSKHEENEPTGGQNTESTSATDEGDKLKAELIESTSKEDIVANENATNGHTNESSNVAESSHDLHQIHVDRSREDSALRLELSKESSSLPKMHVDEASSFSAGDDDHEISSEISGLNAAVTPDNGTEEKIQIPPVAIHTVATDGTSGNLEATAWSQDAQHEPGEMESIHHAERAVKAGEFQTATDSDSIPGMGVLTSNSTISDANERIWSLVALSAPTFSTSTLRGPSQVGYEDFYNDRRSRLHFAGSLSAACQFNETWSFNFGLGYSQFAQHLEFSGMTIDEFPNVLMDGTNESITVHSSLNTVNSENVSFSEFIRPGGSPDNPDDYYLISFREEQNFRFLTIPLTVRYTLGNKNIKGVVDAGVIGTIMVSDASLIEVESRHQSEAIVSFRDYHNVDAFGMQFAGGIGVFYDLQNRASLLILPSWNYSMWNMNSSHEWVIRPWSIGMALGVQYRL